MTRNGTTCSGPEEPQHLGHDRQEKDCMSGRIPKAHSASKALRDWVLPELLDHRTCSDAGELAAARSRAVAAATAARALDLHSAQNRKGAPPPNHQQLPSHRSQSSIPGAVEKGGANGVSNGLKGHKKSHSQSSITRLGVKMQSDQASVPMLSRSHRTVSAEEEVTYVWRDGRVQLQSSRSVMTVPDICSSSSGQHVEYLWQSGNVQRVVRGSNNELLSAELVPPRSPVKGVNYCIIFFVLAFFVVAIVTLVFILRVLH